MIYHFNTLFSGTSIGKYYNECCRIVPAGNWICLWDADVLTFTTFANYNKYLEEKIAEYPEIRLFSCLTNRVTNSNQRYWPILDATTDIIIHRERAEQLWNEIPDMTRRVNGKIAGFMMLFRKETWEEIGGFSEQGIAAVDTDFSLRCNERYGETVILCGMYVFHYFRLLEECSARHIYAGERGEL
jgi:GT2 family glycosyltransferase